MIIIRINNGARRRAKRISDYCFSRVRFHFRLTITATGHTAVDGAVIERVDKSRDSKKDRPPASSTIWARLYFAP